MHKKFPALFVLCIFLCASSAWAQKVRYVIDGDTFILQNNQRVRMIGINAPEIRHAKYGKKKGEPFGVQSKKYLAHLIEKRDVDLKSDREEFDRYGRRLAYVYLPDGTFVNEKIIKDGYARAYLQFPFVHKKDFLAAEREAKNQKLGMWSGKRPSWRDKLIEFLQFE